MSVYKQSGYLPSDPSMTTAYNFPDLDISPILVEDPGDPDEVQRRGADQRNPSVNDDYLYDVFGGLSLSDYGDLHSVCDGAQGDGQESSLGINRFLQRSSPEIVTSGNRNACNPLAAGDSYNTSSEEVFAAMECEMRRSLFSVAESCDVASGLQDSFSSILGGCRIRVEMGCCKESSGDVRSRLRQMGAVVSRRFTDTTTHVVFSFGGRLEVLKSVFARPRRPFLVDPHWVYECFKSRSRVPEEQFSLYECRYLLNALRRSIDERNATHSRDTLHLENTDDHASPSVSYNNECHQPCRRKSESQNLNARMVYFFSEMELTFSRTMSASELLVKIDLLSKRLDRIVGVPACVLGNRCPSAMRRNVLPGAVTQCGANKDNPKTAVTVEVLRRRTHSAFPLEYREPLCDAVLWARKLRDEQDAICGRSKRHHFANDISGKENEGFGQTYAKDLVTCEKKAVQRIGMRAKDGRCVEIFGSQKGLKPVKDNFELDGLLGLRAPSHEGVYGPLVKTSSSLINNLQLESISEEFVKKRHVRTVDKSREGLVFTGFPRQKEKELHPYVSSLGLKVQGKTNSRTCCLISLNGERTLNVMRAVVLGVPILTVEWIEACLEENRFLPFDKFHYERWQKVIQERSRNDRLLSSLGKIFVCERCSPSSRDLKWLIENSGGQISTNPSDCSLIVAPSEYSLEICCSEEMEVHPPVVIEKYILDCITENIVLEFDDYMEHKVVDEFY